MSFALNGDKFVPSLTGHGPDFIRHLLLPGDAIPAERSGLDHARDAQASTRIDVFARRRRHSPSRKRRASQRPRIE
jgi:hypothetical protein